VLFKGILIKRMSLKLKRKRILLFDFDLLKNDSKNNSLRLFFKPNSYSSEDLIPEKLFQNL